MQTLELSVNQMSQHSLTLSLTTPAISKTVQTESDEESDDKSDVSEQVRNARKLNVNSVYSEKVLRKKKSICHKK